MVFTHLTMADGLSQASVNDVLQDSQGFIWLATENGLDRYDGANVRRFKLERSRPDGLASDYIWALAEDKAGNIWIATEGGGVAVWNRRTDRIRSYRNVPGDAQSLGNDSVRDLLVDLSVNDFDIYVGTSAGALVTSLIANGLTPREVMGLVNYEHPELKGIRVGNIFQTNVGEMVQRMLKLPRILWKITREVVGNVGDVAMTDVTFGFDTALGIATEAIDRLHSTAHSHHRIIVVELMGHNAGWLALGAGIAGGADVVLIPEIPYDVELVAEAIKTRKSRGSGFSIVAVSELSLIHI